MKIAKILIKLLAMSIVSVLLISCGGNTVIEEAAYIEEYAEQACEALFKVEPLVSLRNRINVYSINIVSDNGTIGKNTTAFSSGYGKGTHCYGDLLAVVDSVRQYIPSSSVKVINQIVVLMNDKKSAGTNHNFSISFIPLGEEKYGFEAVCRHEVAGHGIGKLADEYQSAGASVQNSFTEWVQDYPSNASKGFYSNVDITSDVSQIRWSRFLSDSRYEGLVGVFEGGATFDYGVYRPTRNSIMNDNTGCFNSPSREAIYKSIMSSSEDNWSYDYETFVTFDERGRQEDRTCNLMKMNANPSFVPCHEPIMTEITKGLLEKFNEAGISVPFSDMDRIGR